MGLPSPSASHTDGVAHETAVSSFPPYVEGVRVMCHLGAAALPDPTAAKNTTVANTSLCAHMPPSCRLVAEAERPRDSPGRATGQADNAASTPAKSDREPRQCQPPTLEPSHSCSFQPPSIRMPRRDRSAASQAPRQRPSPQPQHSQSDGMGHCPINSSAGHVVAAVKPGVLEPPPAVAPATRPPPPCDQIGIMGHSGSRATSSR